MFEGGGMLRVPILPRGSWWASALGCSLDAVLECIPSNVSCPGFTEFLCRIAGARHDFCVDAFGFAVISNPSQELDELIAEPRKRVKPPRQYPICVWDHVRQTDGGS